jgi:4-hydroxybenzoate polyprenyltransferase
MVATEDQPGPSRLGAFARLMRLDRPIGILLLLWPTLWALWLAADGVPPLGTLAIFVTGVVLTRSAGCVINDYADRWLDPKVERTRGRPLATGEVGTTDALILFAVLMLGALGLVLMTNALTVYLALAAAVLAISYPYMKRHIAFPQVVLGAAFSMSIPMAYTAIRGEVDAVTVLLFCANLLWTTAYDTFYAMVDRDDDIQAGARSTAILFGELDLVAIGILNGSALLTLALVGQRAELGTPYFAGLVVAALLLAWQLWHARDRESDECFRAFRNNNWVGMAIFAGLAVSYAMAA